MPYADPIKKKAYYERHVKFYAAEWKKKNRERWNKYQRERRRGERNKKLWEKIKSNPDKHEKHKKYSVKSRLKNKHTYSARDRERTKKLTDTYVRDQLIKGGASYQSLIDNPVLVEAKRILLLIKRKIKNHD